MTSILQGRAGVSAATSSVTLGLGRVALGTLLLVDLFRRWPDLDVWYTNAGLLPNHTMLWAPQARLHFSPFFAAAELFEARFFVLLIVPIYLALLLGWRTRLMTFLAMLAHVFLDCRVHYLTNGGDVALSCLLVWANFLPLGSWLSIDALLAKLRASRLVVNDAGVASLTLDPAAPAELFRPPQELRTWGAAALVLQVAVIYFFNFVHKDGPSWSEGRVLYDVLHQDRIATWLAVELRQWLTPQLSMIGTKATLAAEALLPVLLLVPLAPLLQRRVAVVLGLGLHVSFAAFINLGVFSWVMMLLWLLLLPHEDAVRLVRLLTRRRAAPGSAGTLYFDADCGICSLTARGLLAVQATNPVGPAFALKANAVAAKEVKVDEKRLDEAVLWVDPSGAQLWGAQAIAAVLRCVPFATPLVLLAGSSLGHRLYVRIAKNRIAISSFLGLGACGISRAPEPFSPVAPWRQWLEVRAPRAGNLALAFIFAVFVGQVLAQHRAVPAAIKLTVRPLWIEWPVEYLHFFQGWRMFDESPRTDSTVVVRATTVDGRRVDPLSERASPESAPGAANIPGRLGHNEYFCDYISRIADDGRYHAPLRDWILAYPLRTGRPEDSIVSFEAVLVSDVSPAMGAPPNPTGTTERVFLRYP